MWQVEWENIYLKNGRQRSACVNRLLEFALAVQYPLGSAQADFGSYLHKFLPWDLTSLGYICADGSLIIPDSSWFKWSKRQFCSCASHLVVNFGVCFPSSAILVNFPTRLSWPKQSWLGFFFFKLNLLLVNMICTWYLIQTILFLIWRCFSGAFAQHDIALHVREPLQNWRWIELWGLTWGKIWTC